MALRPSFVVRGWGPCMVEDLEQLARDEKVKAAGDERARQEAVSSIARTVFGLGWVRGPSPSAAFPTAR